MSFYFYDYETFGANPKTARIAQFAGIRTDSNLNILSEKMLYCKPAEDSLPDPISCHITGISPQLCLSKGLIEREFIKQIQEEFSPAGTCVVGYNNIRFDDEFTRYTLYRNFYDPYGWSWKKGNSRWDLLDVVRMCYALKPETLKWPYDDEIPSFKLDRLAPENGIIVKAHDALEDVRATIAIAKIIKKKQPKLFDYALSLRNKKTVASKIELFTPMLYTSGMYPAKFGATRRCIALGFSPLGNAIVFNLDQDPEILLDLEVAELKKLQFTKSSDLPQGVERLQIKELHFNKSPMFIPNVEKLSTETTTHLSIDMEQTDKYLAFILKNKHAISEKIKALYQKTEFEKSTDAEQSLYDGFLSNNDRAIADEINSANADNLSHIQPQFEDDKLHKLFITFKARNHPDILNDEEREYWFEIIQNRIQNGANGYLNIDEFEQSLSRLKQEFPQKNLLWQDLENYVNGIV